MVIGVFTCNQTNKAMKYILLFGILFSLTLTTNAHHSSRRSAVSFYVDQPFYVQVYLNGFLVNRSPESFVEIDNLRPGKHFVKIKAFGPRRIKYLTSVIHVRPGIQVDYLIGSYGRQQGLYLTREATYRKYAHHSHSNKGFQCRPHTYINRSGRIVYNGF